MSRNSFLAYDRSTWPPFLEECQHNFTSGDVNLTIVVPCFNAASFISETLHRIRDVADTEILILDDGSSDQTLEIARILLAKHSNYGIFTLKRKGAPGQARNFGASIARGKWVWFLDCDDLPMKSNLKELFEVGVESSCDLLILRYMVRYDQTKLWADSFDNSLFSELSKSNYKVFSSWRQEPRLVRLSPHPSRMIYSKAFLMHNKLQFDIDETFEDGSFWPRAMLQAQNILTWNWPELVYRVRQDSITHSQDLDRKLFLLSQFTYIFKDEKLVRSENTIFWGHTYIYGLEMIIWPLKSLNTTYRKEYKWKARIMLNDLGAQWFAKNVRINRTERLLIVKSLLKFGCIKLSLLCFLGYFK